MSTKEYYSRKAREEYNSKEGIAFREALKKRRNDEILMKQQEFEKLRNSLMMKWHALQQHKEGQQTNDNLHQR